MAPRPPRWFLSLPGAARIGLVCLVFGLAYFSLLQVSLYHWGFAAFVPFMAFWILPYRYWPWLVLTQIAVAISTGVLVSRVTGDADTQFLGHWPGPVQFALGTFVNPVTNMIGPWIMRRAGIDPFGKVTPRTLGWLHVAAIANFVPPVIKDIIYVTYEGRIGDVRHNIRGGYSALGSRDDLQRLAEFAISHLMGGFIGVMITVPLVLWWLGRKLEKHNALVLREAAFWLLPMMAAYLACALATNGHDVAELLRLLLMSGVIVFSVRHGWRGAAISVFATSLAVAIEDHLLGGVRDPVWQQLFVAIVGAMALLFGSALDELRQRNKELDAASKYADALARNLQSAASRNVEAEERERKRLAAELHDEFGQSLVALQAQINHVLPLLEQNAMRETAAAMQETTASLHRHIGTTLDSLRPPTLDALGLFGALDRGSLRTLAARAGVDYTVDLRGDARLLAGLGEAQRMAAYRIVQGALSNTIRHAAANQCRVRLRIDERGGALWLIVTVDDDGCGRVEALSARHGLTGLQDRVTALGGVFRMRNLPQGLRMHALLGEPAHR